MEPNPLNQLNLCSFRGCGKDSEVLVERLVGGKLVIYGYCQFHGIISATFFSVRKYRKVIRV